MSTPFSALEQDFLRITGEVVFCTATTVDGRARPRCRICIPCSSSATGGPSAGR